jgi:hypothetical protein
MVNKLLIGVGIVALVAVGSIGVWQLAGDDGRRVGALEPIEKPVPLAWRGAWTRDTEYAVGEVVSYENSSYVAQAANAGATPTAKEGPWALMAARGLQGPAGTFSGSFQSPNGSYSLVVADDGIVLQGPPGTIKLRNSGVELMINNNVSVNAGQNLTLQSSAGAIVKASGAMTVEAGGQLNLKGAVINQN